jgi:hypothetical protein
MQNAIEIGNRGLETARPLASPMFAAALLDCSYYNVLHHIEDGRLPLAFDIGRPGAARHFVRMATASVLAVRAGLRPSADIRKFFAGAFSPDKPVYRASRLAWMLQCDCDHIYHLVAARVLADAGGATRYQIPRESIIKFLTQRRLN